MIISFQNLSQQNDLVKVAYDQIKVVSHSNPLFDDTLLQIYQNFVQAAANSIGINN